MRLRKNLKRTAAAAMALGMVVSTATPAATAAYYVKVDKNTSNVTVVKDENGTVTVTKDGSAVDDDGDGTDDVIIYGGEDKPDHSAKKNTFSSESGDSATQEAKEDAQPVVTDEDTSGQESVDSDQTPEEKDTDPSGSSSDHSETPEDTEGKPAAPEDETEASGESDGEEEAEDDSETEDKAEGQTGAEGGETQPEGDAPAEGTEQPAGDSEGQPAFDTQELKGASTSVSEEKEETYDKAPTTFAEQVGDGIKTAAQNTAKAIIKIINKMKNVTNGDGTVTADNTLNVTLDNVTVDATGRNDSALTVSGEGDTKLTLSGSNKLTGDSGKSGLLHTKETDDASLGTLTITGTKNDSLTAEGGASTEGNGGDGIRSSGDLTLSGGTIKATGGNGNTSKYKSNGNGGSGIYSSGKLTLSGSTIDATGGNGNVSEQCSSGNGGDGIYSSELTISGGTIKATGGNGNTTNNYYTSGCGGNGIKADSKLTMSNGTIELAQGGNGQYQSIYDNDHSNCAGREGISGGQLEITGGTINNALGGNGQKGGRGGNGINGSVIHIGGTAKINNAQGGNTDSSTGIGSCGISSRYVTIDGNAEVTAKGGSNSSASAGIYSEKGIKIKDNATVKATAGTSNSGSTSGFMVYVSYGPQKKKAEDVLDKDSNATATAYKNDNTIDSTATGTGGGSTGGGGSGSGSGSGTGGGSENPGSGSTGGGSENPGSGSTGGGSENPGGGSTGGGSENPGGGGTDDPGETPNPGTTGVTPGNSDSGSSSDSDSSAPAPVQEPVVITPAGVPGYTVTDAAGSNLHVNADVNGSTIQFRTLRYKASLHTTLGQLRAQGVTRVTFRTLLGRSTLTVNELLPLGGDETEVVLTRSGSSATLTVGGVQHNELIH